MFRKSWMAALIVIASSHAAAWSLAEEAGGSTPAPKKWSERLREFQQNIVGEPTAPNAAPANNSGATRSKSIVAGNGPFAGQKPGSNSSLQGSFGTSNFSGRVDGGLPSLAPHKKPMEGVKVENPSVAKQPSSAENSSAAAPSSPSKDVSSSRRAVAKEGSTSNGSTATSDNRPPSLREGETNQSPEATIPTPNNGPVTDPQAKAKPVEEKTPAPAAIASEFEPMPVVTTPSRNMNPGEPAPVSVLHRGSALQEKITSLRDQGEPASTNANATTAIPKTEPLVVENKTATENKIAAEESPREPLKIRDMTLDLSATKPPATDPAAPPVNIPNVAGSLVKSADEAAAIARRTVTAHRPSETNSAAASGGFEWKKPESKSPVTPPTWQNSAEIVTGNKATPSPTLATKPAQNTPTPVQNITLPTPSAAPVALSPAPAAQATPAPIAESPSTAAQTPVAKSDLAPATTPQNSTPSAGGTFSLTTRTPATHPADANVTKPKLGISVAGPREIAYGQTTVFTLSLSNTGNQDAENVIVRLLPIDNSDAGASQKIGRLTAGEMKVLEVELIARQVGPVVIRAQLAADGDMRAEAKQDVQVTRETPLQITVRGPETIKRNSTTNYVIVVKNMGSDPIEKAEVSAELPNGATFAEASCDGRLSGDHQKVEWPAFPIRGGAEIALEVKCQTSAAGAYRLLANVAAGPNVRLSGETLLKVENFADLKIDVVEPQTQTIVGQEAAYEIHVANRGNKAAEKIDLRALFSRGIEPVSASGSPYQFGDGSVNFATISRIEPGKELVLKVKAVADQPGQHVFRVEAESAESNQKLAWEQAKQYTDAVAAKPGESPNDRTARRTQSGEPTPAKPR